MFDREGKDAIGRPAGVRQRAKVKRRPAIESLESRELMTASIEPIAAVTSPQFQGYQVPVQGGTTHQQTYTVTSDNPGIKASVAQGQFLTIHVTHTSSGGTDPNIDGDMVFQLFGDVAPNTVQQITSLITGTATNTNLNTTITNADGTTTTQPLGFDYYDGKTFNRVVKNFVIQAGANTNGSPVFKTPFPDEFTQSVAFTGTGQLAMANAGADTNDSQFFITSTPTTTLDYHHTIWGQIVRGQDVLAQVNQVATTTTNALVPGENSSPVSPVTIQSTTLSNVSPDGVIHIDTTVAPLGAVGNVTVTATDVTDGTTATQTFPVTVSAANSNPLRPFIGQYDPAITIPNGTPSRIQINAVSPTPGDALTYIATGSVVNGAFVGVDTTKITSAVVDQTTGVVTITPVAGATGATTVLIGVRDATNRGGSTIDAPANYEYHTIQVTLSGTATAASLRPLGSAPTLVTASAGQATPITLIGSPAATGSTDALTYTVTGQPSHGTISGLDAATGALTYTPQGDYTGPDALTYTVTDPTTGQTSLPSTVQINVAFGNTNAVRFIADNGTNSTTTPGVLVVTPVPRTDGGTNTITASMVNGAVRVSVNGATDLIQPPATDVDRLVVYGSKANDTIVIDPTLSAIATLDGGHGGTNVLRAGSGQTREHGWFGTNKLVQGSSDNYQLGRQGIGNKFVKGTGSSNVIFLGVPGHFTGHLNRNRQLPTPTTGNFYKFGSNGKTLVEAPNPYNAINKAQRKTFRAQQAAGRKGAAATTGGATGGTSTGGTTTGDQGTNGTTGTAGAPQ